ncbi:MAG: peptide-methionine (S)-S-oxide reductase, partial [Spirochaetes bacterium RBG_13_51_14]
KGANPTYNDYSEKGHIEAVQITYDPSIITYARILDVFWRQIDPTDSKGQFCDRGPQYRPAVFYENTEQKTTAEQSKAALVKSGRFKKPVTTEIIAASAFHPAEEYHQDYHKKNPLRYKYYRYRCGRDQFLESVWGQSRR